MIFKDFLSEIEKTYENWEFEMRHGQVVMNVLHKVWPEKYNEITGTDIDCFYNDGIVVKTLDKLQKEWNND